MSDAPPNLKTSIAVDLTRLDDGADDAGMNETGV
jgi:hypothetical protein